jgi:hypothetical protein
MHFVIERCRHNLQTRRFCELSTQSEQSNSAELSASIGKKAFLLDSSRPATWPLATITPFRDLNSSSLPAVKLLIPQLSSMVDQQ